MEIYKLTSPSGKVYIGKCTSFVKRMDQHFTESQNPRSHRSHLYAAVRKYGWTTFQKNILEEMIPKDLIDERERFWIQHYQSMNPKIGYNLTEGGTGGDTFSLVSPEEQERRSSLSRRQVSEKTRYKISTALKERYQKVPHPSKGKLAWNKGKSSTVPSINKGKSREEIFGYRSEEIYNKISSSLKGKSPSKEVRDKISKTLQGRKPSIDAVLKRSKSAQKTYSQKLAQKIVCPHCGHISLSRSGDGPMRRWHFENCRSRGIIPPTSINTE